MKRAVKILLGILSYSLPAENINSQYMGVQAGHSILPADYFSLRYTHYSNLPINAAIGIFYEASHTGGLNYTNCGLDILAEYASSQGDFDKNIFGFRLGAGLSWQTENEPWIYQGLSAGKRMNYGLIGELAGEWGLSQNFCLSAFVQQKILFNKPLGTTRFAFGLGLKICLGNF